MLMRESVTSITQRMEVFKEVTVKCVESIRCVIKQWGTSISQLIDVFTEVMEESVERV